MAKNSKCLQHNSIGVRIMQGTKRVKDPGKQRKKLFNAPAHIRHKLMSAPLSPELSASKGGKALPVRRGDTIRIKRGDNKGFEGKVSRVDLKAYRIYIEGLTREKVDGTNIFLPIHPSKVEIRNLNLDDKWRKAVLGRKATLEKKEKPKNVPAKKAEKLRGKSAKKVEAATKIEVEAEKEVEKLMEETAPIVAKKQEPDTKKEEKPKPKKAGKPANKAVKPKAMTKKVPAAKKTEEKETTDKPRAKSKTTKKVEGGQ